MNVDDHHGISSQGISQLMKVPRFLLKKNFLSWHQWPLFRVRSIPKRSKVIFVTHHILFVIFMFKLMLFNMFMVIQNWMPATTYVVYATMKDIMTRTTWWYTACLYSKAVFLDSNMYFCEKCYKVVFFCRIFQLINVVHIWTRL